MPFYLTKYSETIFLLAGLFLRSFCLGYCDCGSCAGLKQFFIRPTTCYSVFSEVVAVSSFGDFRREVNGNISMGKFDALCSKTLLDASVHLAADNMRVKMRIKTVETIFGLIIFMITPG